jgi:hypothetical protein
MINPMHKPRSCHLFRAQHQLVILRDDFLSSGLRVGNTEAAEVLSLASDQQGQDDTRVGEAVLRAFSRVELLASPPERNSGYIPSYVSATGFASIKSFEASCPACGCIESVDHILIFPMKYDPRRGCSQDDRSNQVSEILDPSAIGRTALMLLL